MRTFIVSDHEPITRRVREALLREGVDCPQEHLLPMSLDLHRLRKMDPELIVLILQPDPEAALAMLARLREFPLCAVVVVGPANDTKFVLRVCHVGVHDYINEENVSEELAAAIHRLQRETTLNADVNRTIAVYSPNGGCGVSTLAGNLAILLAKKHEKTLLVDLNLQAGDQATLFDLRPTHTLAELCEHAGQLDRTMLERAFASHPSGIHLLAPPFHIADVERISPQGIRQTLALSRKFFPHMVIDVAHTLTPCQMEALTLADIILLVVRLDFTVLRNSRRILEYFDRLQLSRDRVRIVANRYGQSMEVPYAKAEQALGMKISHYVPEDAKTVNRANNCGVPVVLESPRSRASRSLSNLALSLMAGFAATRNAQAE